MIILIFIYNINLNSFGSTWHIYGVILSPRSTFEYIEILKNKKWAIFNKEIS